MAPTNVGAIFVCGGKAGRCVPVGTADSRIREGLKRLRVDLDTQADGDARPWLMALCPAVDLSVNQAATAAATGGSSMTKIAMTKIARLLAALILVGVVLMTQRGASGEDSHGNTSLVAQGQELSSSDTIGSSSEAGATSPATPMARSQLLAVGRAQEKLQVLKPFASDWLLPDEFSGPGIRDLAKRSKQ